MVKQKTTHHKAHNKKTTHTKEQKTQKHTTTRFFAQTTTWVVIFLLFFFIILPLLFLLMFNNRIYPNTYVGNINLTGKTLTQATSEIEMRYKDIGNTELTLIFEEKNWIVPLSDIGTRINSSKSADLAMDVGRDNNLLENVKTVIGAFKNPVVSPVVVSFDSQKYETISNTITQEIAIPLIEPAIEIQDETITITPGSNGRTLDNEKLKNEIIETLTYQKNNPIYVPVTSLTTDVSKLEEEETKKRAESLLDKKLTLIIEENYYDLENEEIISLLSFKGGFDFDKIGSLSANLSHAYNKPPQNAAFNFENGRVIAFKPGKDGQKIDTDKAIPLIQESLISLEATTSADKRVLLPVVTTPPEITTSEVNNLGIQELLGRGVSYFRGSIASRVHNIELAATRLNGILIKPGETFSFNQGVGDISQTTGFQQAYVIQNGRTILGDGGGVCQVSTTLFRAVLNTGLPVNERTAHAYRVGYYEQGFGAGIDATIFQPSVDLKFTNDTPAHILIQAYPSRRSQSLVFEFYGTSDGRRAYISTPRVWDQIPPPPPRYEDDPTLPVGTEKQVDWAAWGAKAAFDYKVTRNGETLIDKTFYSNFRPWQAVYLRGTQG